MTTDKRPNYVLRGALLWSVAPLVIAVVAGLVVSGVPGLVGGATGAAVTVAVLGLGTWIVIKATEASPTASLMAALCVFTAQGGLLLATLGIVSAVASQTHVTWAAVAIVAVTVVWTSAFGYFVRKERIPLFDLMGSDAS